MSRRILTPAEARAHAEWRRFHWGNEPTELYSDRAPAVTPNTVLVGMGELVEVVYWTAKGGGRAVEYVHAFEGERPVLAYNEAGKIVVVGGSYKIRARGIVG